MIEIENEIKTLMEKGKITANMKTYLSSPNSNILSAKYEGINIVVASIVANVSSQEKVKIVKYVGSKIPNETYEEMIKSRFTTIHPIVAHELIEKGIIITKEIEKQYSNEYDVFDFIFPFLPLSVGLDILLYIQNEKDIKIERSEISKMKDNSMRRQNYSRGEIEKAFEVLK